MAQPNPSFCSQFDGPLARLPAGDAPPTWYVSRLQYPERLDQYVLRARRSIRILSVSLKLASAQGDMHGALARKIMSAPGFQVQLSLLDPTSAAVEVLALGLREPANDLRDRLRESLRGLERLRASLPATYRRHFDLRVHEVLPFGAAYILDAERETGTIHVETKLHGAPTSESFGYRVTGPGDFYSRNRRAWLAIIERSRPVPWDARDDASGNPPYSPSDEATDAAQQSSSDQVPYFGDGGTL